MSGADSSGASQGGGGSREQREARELRDAVRALHRELLLAVQRLFEKLHGRVQGPGQLLELAVHDPLFVWLKPLSARLVELEELERDGVDAVRFEALRAGVEHVLERDAEFSAVYRGYLQAEPEVVVAHARVRRAFAAAARTGTASRA